VRTGGGAVPGGHPAGHGRGAPIRRRGPRRGRTLGGRSRMVWAELYSYGQNGGFLRYWDSYAL